MRATRAPTGIDASNWNGGNRILAALPAKERAALQPHLEKQTLASGEVLYEQGARIDAVYFPETAVDVPHQSHVGRCDGGGRHDRQ